MKAGKWKLNGETIIFDKDGTLFPRTMIMGCGYWIFRCGNAPEIVRDFLNRLVYGYEIKRRHPIMKLRNRVLNMKMRALDTQSRDNLIEQILRVWNAMDGSEYDSKDKVPKEPFAKPKVIKALKL